MSKISRSAVMPSNFTQPGAFAPEGRFGPLICFLTFVVLLDTVSINTKRARAASEVARMLDLSAQLSSIRPSHDHQDLKF